MSKRNNTKLDIILAQIFTWVLNPFFILPITIIASHLQQINKNPMPFIFFIAVTGIPLFLAYLYIEHKHKQSPWQFFISIPREERNLPLMISIYVFLFSGIVFTSLNEILWQKISILFVIFCGVMYLANKYIDKASWHAAALAFCIFYVVDKVNYAFAFGLILLPVIFWSRILLHKHSWVQLYLGTVLGMIIGILSWTIK
jgi:hypothetical protein